MPRRIGTGPGSGGGSGRRGRVRRTAVRGRCPRRPGGSGTRAWGVRGCVGGREDRGAGPGRRRPSSRCRDGSGARCRRCPAWRRCGRRLSSSVRSLLRGFPVAPGDQLNTTRAPGGRGSGGEVSDHRCGGKPGVAARTGPPRGRTAPPTMRRRGPGARAGRWPPQADSPPWSTGTGRAGGPVRGRASARPWYPVRCGPRFDAGGGGCRSVRPYADRSSPRGGARPRHEGVGGARVRGGIPRAVPMGAFPWLSVTASRHADPHPRPDRAHRRRRREPR